MKFKGFVEASSGTTLAGWAVDEEGLSCEITFSVNNGEPVRINTSIERPDLAKLGISAGHGGFSIDTEPYLSEGDNVLELRFPNGTPIPGSPLFKTIGSAHPVEQSYQGYVENREPHDVRGWGVTGAGLPCVLTVTVNGSSVTQAPSDRPRPDLARQNMSNGLGGFTFDLRPFLLGGEVNSVAITFADGGHLRGSPFDIGSDDSVLPVVQPAVAKRVQSNVSKAKMPSLAELDELSLDDLSLAVATGIVDIPPPIHPEVEAPVSDHADEPPLPPAVQPRRGLFARLFARR